MKRILSIALFFGLQAYTFCQTVNYETIKDEPYEPKISINLDLFNMDLNTGFSNIRLDNTSMNLGVFGYVQVIDNLEVDFNLHKSWLTLGKIGYKDYPGNTELNAGATLWLTKNEKVKSTKIILKQTDGTRNGEDVTTTTYITVPAKRLTRKGVRAGFYSKSGPFNFQDYAGDDVNSTIDQTKISSIGMYGGLSFRNNANVIIRDDVYGKSSCSRGRDLYIEGLFVPVNRFKDLNAENALVSETVKDVRTTLPVGFRVGFRTYQIEQKTCTGKKFGMSKIGEFGYKPFQGWFITAGIGLTLIKQ